MVNSNTVSLVVNAAAAGNVTITLTIESAPTNAASVPISGASVVWTSASTGETYPGTSNSSGVCAVVMPSGLYYLEVSATGYTTYNSSPNTETCTTSWSATIQLTAA